MEGKFSLLSIESVDNNPKKAIVSQEACSHPATIDGNCTQCGKNMGNSYGMSFGYIRNGLRLSNAEIARLRESRWLSSSKKIHLVLDLDGTLLSTVGVQQLSDEEQYLLDRDEVSHKDVFKNTLFMLENLPMLTKLRPFVHKFLKEASDMFELYIYTMGAQIYVTELVKLLDPHQANYFEGRVISREFSRSYFQKSLDVVLAPPSSVLILDDMEDAWANDKENLIVMAPYAFFTFCCLRLGRKCKSYAEMKMDEDEHEHEGTLSSILEVLKDVHREFFNEDDASKRDVRKVLKMVRSKVLKGCVIAFSNKLQSRDRVWSLAEELGADCATSVGSCVTHVVAEDVDEEVSNWAKQEGKFLVSKVWILVAHYQWKRKPEEDFSVAEGKKTRQDWLDFL